MTKKDRKSFSEHKRKSHNMFHAGLLLLSILTTLSIFSLKKRLQYLEFQDIDNIKNNH